MGLFGHALEVRACEVPRSRGREIDALALEEEVDFRKSGALEFVASPALAHQLIEVARAPSRSVDALEYAVIRLQMGKIF